MDQMTPKFEDDSNGLLQAVKSGNLQVLQVPYETYKAEFMMFGAKFGASKDDLLDAYQDAFVALIENVQHKGISTLRSSLKTYVFGIAKFILFKKLRQDKRSVQLPDSHWNYLEQQDLPQDLTPTTKRQDKLRLALSELSPKCREIITLFYYRQWTIKEIMEGMGYLNENTVKAHKSRCMKTLWQKIQSKL